MVVPPTALNLLRNELRNTRQHIAVERKDFPLLSNAILEKLLAGTKSVALYRAMGGEPDPWPLIGNFTGITALPTLSAGDPLMTFRRWERGDSLVAMSWGGQQPIDTALRVVPDLFLVPMLGFDAAFNRIGQGGGYYDRYLAAHPAACRIGIAWEAQRVDNIDAQPWDVPMDAILTETEFYIKDLTRCQRP